MCFEAKEWWEENKKKGLKLENLFVNASTYRHKRGLWGEYRKFKEEASRAGTTKDEIIAA